MAGEASRKAIVAVQNTDIRNPQEQWDRGIFDDALVDKGYDCYIERAMSCPCIVKGTNSPMPNCLNCGGTGWFFIDKVKSRILCSSMNNINKYQPWSAENIGTVNISVRAQDKLGYMDKITLTEVQSWYSQYRNLIKNEAEDSLFAFTTYEMILAFDVYLFRGSESPLLRLNEGDDYSVDRNKIILNYSKFGNIVNPRISIRYVHNPTYHVLDINRDLIRQQSTGNCSDGKVANYPLSCVGKKAQYLFDLPNFDGTRLFDNTDYNKDLENYDYGSNQSIQRDCLIQTNGNLYNFLLTQGDSFEYSLRMMENGQPVDVSSRTYKMQVKDVAGTLITEFTSGNGGVVILMPNTVKLYKTTTQTAALDAGIYYYDLQETSGTVINTILSGKFEVIQQITT